MLPAGSLTTRPSLSVISTFCLVMSAPGIRCGEGLPNLAEFVDSSLSQWKRARAFVIVRKSVLFTHRTATDPSWRFIRHDSRMLIGTRLNSDRHASTANRPAAERSAEEAGFKLGHQSIDNSPPWLWSSARKGLFGALSNQFSSSSWRQSLVMTRPPLTRTWS